MQATLIYRKKEFSVRAGMTIRAALEKINIEPESIIATRDGELVTDDELIEGGDVIKLISVISGG